MRGFRKKQEEHGRDDELPPTADRLLQPRAAHLLKIPALDLQRIDMKIGHEHVPGTNPRRCFFA